MTRPALLLSFTMVVSALVLLGAAGEARGDWYDVSFRIGGSGPDHRLSLIHISMARRTLIPASRRCPAARSRPSGVCVSAHRPLFRIVPPSCRMLETEEVLSLIHI